MAMSQRLELEVERRRPYLPVIHSAKAFNVTAGKKGTEPQVRCFYAMAHREHNPHNSEYHIEARLGFRRAAKRPVRLRPLEERRQPKAALGGSPARTQVPSPKKRSDEYKVDVAAVPPRGVLNDTGVVDDANFRGVLSDNGAAVDEIYRSSNQAESLEAVSVPQLRSASKSDSRPASQLADSRPITALAPEQGGVDWLEYENVTEETLSALFGDAMGDPKPQTGKGNLLHAPSSFGQLPDDADSDFADAAVVDVTDGFSKVGTETAWRSIQKGFEGAFEDDGFDS
mmetsp:Transcript_22252/g.50813  ORF Transcript_22252/g.50813 Transcript_22252/m.50813 type:complete len:285 (+) Transcript_22252:89-943(+)